jgi:hypothetical protein
VSLEQLLIGERIALEQECRPVPLLGVLAQLKSGAMQRRSARVYSRFGDLWHHGRHDSRFG